MIFNRPIDEHRFRAATARMAGQATGAMTSRFRCQACGEDKLIDGRKELVKGYRKFGFVCAQCDERRQARRAAKAQKLIKEAA